MAGRKIRDEREALRFLSAAAKSGQQRADWAREHDIDGRSLNAWRMNLEKGGRGFLQDQDCLQDLRLVELVPTRGRAPTRYRVWCGELAVEVDDSFDDEVLGRILGVMVRC